MCLVLSLKLSSESWNWRKARKQYNEDCEYEFDEAARVLKLAQEGDLIEIKRSLISHWAVYYGKRNVIHLTVNLSGILTIQLDTLLDVTAGSLCRVNNLVNEANKRGYVARNVAEIVKIAYNDLDRIDKYHILYQNCEHFATYCRYGRAFSVQAEIATDCKPLIKTIAPIAQTSSNSTIRGKKYTKKVSKKIVVFIEDSSSAKNQIQIQMQ